MKLYYKPGLNHLAIERRRKARLRTVNRRIVRDEKRRRGCELCGKMDLDFHELHFHHRDSTKKIRKISWMVSSSTAALIDEMMLCRLWCKWAHRYFHSTGEVRPCAHAFAPLREGAINEL